jgi:hypothetical protein
MDVQKSLMVEVILPSLVHRESFSKEYLNNVGKQIASVQKEGFRLAICGLWRDQTKHLKRMCSTQQDDRLNNDIHHISMNQTLLVPIQEEAATDSTSSWPAVKLLTCIWAEAESNKADCLTPFALKKSVLLFVGSGETEHIPAVILKKTSIICS